MVGFPMIKNTKLDILDTFYCILYQMPCSYQHDIIIAINFIILLTTYIHNGLYDVLCVFIKVYVRPYVNPRSRLLGNIWWYITLYRFSYQI